MRATPLWAVVLLWVICACSPDFRRQKYTDFGHVRAKRLNVPSRIEDDASAVAISLRADVPAVSKLAAESIPTTRVQPDTLISIAEDTVDRRIVSPPVTRPDGPDERKETVYVPFERNEKTFRIVMGGLSVGWGIAMIAVGVASASLLIPFGLVAAAAGVLIVVIAIRGRKVPPPSPEDAYPEGDPEFLALAREFRIFASLGIWLTVLGIALWIIAMFQMIGWLALFGGPVLFLAMIFSFVALNRSRRLGRSAAEQHFRIDEKTRKLRNAHKVLVGVHIAMIAALFVYGVILIYGWI